MSLRYVSHDHYAHSFDTAFEDSLILYFDPRMESSNEPVGDRMRELGDEVRAADLIVLRGSNRTFFQEVEEDLVLPESLEDVPVLVLSPEWDPADPAPRLRKPGWSPDALKAPDLGELRNLELLAMLEQSGAIFEEPNCHYELPSQLHGEAFVRLADCLCDVIDTTRIADWIIPHLRPEVGLLADNGSLQALLMTAVLETQERFGWPRIPIMTLRRYPNSDRLAERLDGFRRQGWEGVVGVISVNSSGELAKLFAAREEVERTIVVCETNPKSRGEALCHRPVVTWRVEDGPHCEVCGDKYLLVVDTQSYEVRTDLHGEPQPPKVSIAEEQKALWEAADRTDAVHLHIEREIPKRSGTDVTKTRHMAVYIDIAALLGDPTFREEVLEELRAGGEPDVVVIPEHASTAALEALVREAFELGENAVLRYAGNELSRSDRETLADAREVLIIDDALITGSTLFRIRNEIYRITQEIERQIQFRAFVVVSRPASKNAEKAVEQRFTMPHPDGPGRDVRFRAAARALLPSDRECPFCQELKALTRRREQVTEKTAITDRINALTSRSDGLQEPILLGGTEGTGKTVGSFFGELKPRTAIAAAASVAQRQKREFETHRRANTIEVLNTSLVIDAYFDPGLMAGVLRNFDRRDLRNPEQDQKFDEALRERGKELADGAVVEIAWAAALNKLPAEGIIRLLEENETIEARELLLELLRLD